MTFPDGTIALPFTTGGALVNPLTTSREMVYKYDLLDRNGVPLGDLSGVTGGTLEWNANSQIKGGGRISMIDTGAEIDWLNVRIRPVLQVVGVTEWPLGVFVPSAPIERWEKDERSWDIELLDRTSALDQDKVDQTFSLPIDTVVTTAVRDLIASTGESVGAITESTEKLTAPMVWQAGTSKLTIINDLLGAAGFWTLWADGNGQFRVQRYVQPQDRPVTYHMLDDENSIYTPDFEIDKDIYAIPNKVISIGQGTGSAPAVIGIATNENPDSPYSYQSRGRWITHVEEFVEATSQEAIDLHAQRSLAQRTSPSSGITVKHAPMPNWWVNDVVWFRSAAAHVDKAFTITTTTISLSPTELATTTLTEVADL